MARTIVNRTAFAVCSVLIAAALVRSLTITAQTPRPSPTAEFFSQYCVTCHNARLKTAGLVIEPAELSHIQTNPELWEKVVRKLRSEAMPPAGSPRPNARM